MTQPAHTESKLVEAAHVWRESRVSGVLIDKSSGARLRRGEEGYAEARLSATVRKSRRFFLYKRRHSSAVVLAGKREFTVNRVSEQNTDIRLEERVFQGSSAVVARQLLCLYREEGRDLRDIRRRIRDCPATALFILYGAKAYFPPHWSVSGGGPFWRNRLPISSETLGSEEPALVA